MRVGVLGTGTVGRTLASRLVGLGNEAMLGSRDAANETAAAWAAEHGERATHGTFADAAAFGALVVNATAGAASLDALATVAPGALDGKTLLDVANPLDFSRGFPPTLAVCNDDSLAESIQRAHPGARVVKALNTVNAGVMVDPSRVPGPHSMFVAGDDEAAKAEVRELLVAFGWPAEDVVDLGDLTAARGMEMYLPLWLRLFRATGTADVNVAVRVAPPVEP